MKDTGVARKLDPLGRIVFPMEVRKIRGLNERDAMEIYVDGKDVVLEKVEENQENRGMIRLIDELGRVVIPIEIRESLDLKEGDKMEVYLKDEKIILRKYYDVCIYCGKKGKLQTILGKPICKSCEKKLKKELQEIE